MSIANTIYEYFYKRFYPTPKPISYKVDVDPEWFAANILTKQEPFDVIPITSVRGAIWFGARRISKAYDPNNPPNFDLTDKE